MYNLVPFETWHFAMLNENDPSKIENFSVDMEILRQLRGPHTFTLFYDDLPVACGGFVPQWPYRYT